MRLAKLKDDIPHRVRLRRIVRDGIERDDEQGCGTGVLERMRHTGRENEAPRFVRGHIDRRELIALAITNSRRTYDCADLGADMVIMIAADLTRLGQHDVHVALRSKLKGIERLENLAAGVGRTPEFLDGNCHASNRAALQ